MIKAILKATFVAGSLDICAAFAQAYLSNGVTPDIVLQYIASGIFGKEAYSGAVKYILFGLAVHFFIVLMCAVTYFLSYTKVSFLKKSIFLSSFLIALIAWVVTTMVIIPLSKIQSSPFNLEKAIIAIAILYFCVGIPISLFAKSYFNKQGSIN
ncbi:hypothetical protein [Niabella ginsengisoli]|uniref:DUF1440 domain-containing protein n=1 Tax=Niabella ginsengisoli TaxID=522298 RepID=A0ABS9SF75_9BACT|nr:hypothetical protein [Niabella ginsengisoli]MCH5597011.1 hypothetical protein [Niabella ginsengisoli]